MIVDFDEEGEKQTAQVFGALSAKDIEQVAFSIMPNMRELLKTTPRWHEGYNGLLQLFTLYYLSEISRYKHDK